MQNSTFGLWWTTQWEDKLREECSKLKKELCRFHAEEKQLAVDSMKLQKDQELSSSKQMWEKQRQELRNEVCVSVLLFSQKFPSEPILLRACNKWNKSYVICYFIKISKLKDEISKKEIECQKEISRATTISDRENMDLRRRVDKLSIAHMDELEDIRAAHSEEMGWLSDYKYRFLYDFTQLRND